MSGQAVRTHTSQSNRATAREAKDRKVVFKSVAQNPFLVQWPSVSVNVQNAVLAAVVGMLGGVPEYNLMRERTSKKRRRSQNIHHLPEAKKAKIDTRVGQETSEVNPGGQNLPPASAPAILESVVVGINEVTRRLEAVARSHRDILHADPQESIRPKDIRAHSRLVIVCKADVDSPLLIGHLPNLVAACNSRRKGDSEHSGTNGTWLMPMPKGAEDVLAEAMGLRRVSILLLEGSAPGFSAIATLLETVPLLSAPWLSPNVEQSLSLVPTHVKQVQTSAPRDMKAAKARRTKERAEAKDRRRTERGTVAKRTRLMTEVELGTLDPC